MNNSRRNFLATGMAAGGEASAAEAAAR